MCQFKKSENYVNRLLVRLLLSEKKEAVRKEVAEKKSSQIKKQHRCHIV